MPSQPADTMKLGLHNNKVFYKGVIILKKMELHSKEFNRVLKNMQLEGLEMSNELQERAINLINSNKPITSQLIKEQFHNGNIRDR